VGENVRVEQKRRRRAVGPKDATPVTDEPLVERSEASEADDRRALERYLADRPPHHEPR
jgi:hypothetical protein